MMLVTSSCRGRAMDPVLSVLVSVPGLWQMAELAWVKSSVELGGIQFWIPSSIHYLLSH